MAEYITVKKEDKKREPKTLTLGNGSDSPYKQPKDNQVSLAEKVAKELYKTGK